jgi:conjugative transfer region protein TrbK
MGGKHLAQIGAIAFVAMAITVALLGLGSKDSAPTNAVLAAPALSADTDPLARELQHCQMIGEAGARDTACLAAWAENRRRFLTPGSAAPMAEPAPSDPGAPSSDKGL